MSQEILELIEKKDFKMVKAILQDMLAPDIADAIEKFDEATTAVLLFRLLPKDLSAEVFSYLSSETQEKIVNFLNSSELSFIIEELATDDAVDFLEEMPANIVRKALKGATPETRKLINKYLSYEEDTAGAIMTPEFISLSIDETTDEALDEIRQQGEEAETINVLYVVDDKKTLKGVLTIKELLLAKKNIPLKEIVNDNVISATTNMDQEKIATIFSKYDFLALPVVDKENRIVGIVTVDDIIDVIKEEATEDFEKIAAIRPTNKPYLKTSVFSIWKNRIPWLMLLMISATFTGLILNIYQEKLSAISTALVACVPMIMDTGGNAGSQASVTVIRAMALGELTVKDWYKVVLKEMIASALLGVTLGVVCFGKLLLIDNLIFGFEGYTVIRCLVVSMVLMFTVIIAKLVGCILPMLAKKCHLDPAVVASPFITTIVDATALIVYCLLAIAILA